MLVGVALVHHTWIVGVAWVGGYLLVLFSPSGKLVQIEYALQAVAAGAPSMGIKAKNGVVLAVEKKQKSFLYDESSITKVSSPLFMCHCS